MKAIVLTGFGSADNFRLEEQATPVPGAGEVLVRIMAAGFNPIDYQMRKGLRESAWMRSPILGREFSGIIEGIGPGVTHFQAGDEVFAASGSMGSNGTYATYIKVPASILALKPAILGFEEAAAIPVAGLTAWQTFTRLGIGIDDLVFITGGAGGVGAFLIRLLKAHGIHQIVTTAGNRMSRAALLSMGLSHSQIMNYRDDHLREAILALYPGRSIDFSVDLVGGPLSLVAAEVLKFQGVYSDITFLAPEATREVLFERGATIVNIANYAYSLAGKKEWFGEQLGVLGQLFDKGTISAPLIQVVGGFAAETVKDAHLLMEHNQTFGCKLVMRVGE
jgi:NADPH:quinone reductase-like Zn-dependent oxidoreductase